MKLEMKFRKMRQDGRFSCKMHCPHSCKSLQNNEFVRGMIPAKQAPVMKAADHERQSDSLTGQMPGDSQRIINAWIIGNSFAIVLVLALFALWFATSGFSWPGNVWQLAVIVPTTLVVLLLIMLIEKSRMRNSEALQVKLDQLIRAAESVHNSILNLEKLSKGESFHLGGANYADWSPQVREDGNSPTTNGNHVNGHHARHRSGAVNSVNHGAGAHRIRPTGKA
ncbi:MAG TPA: low affinity iron permease family protein [Verrucomicrobiae bacterium]|nr:low affinity iron permease family protein [Verrucomicrobiae bacterium]